MIWADAFIMVIYAASLANKTFGQASDAQQFYCNCNIKPGPIDGSPVERNWSAGKVWVAVLGTA